MKVAVKKCGSWGKSSRRDYQCLLFGLGMLFLILWKSRQLPTENFNLFVLILKRKVHKLHNNGCSVFSINASSGRQFCKFSKPIAFPDYSTLDQPFWYRIKPGFVKEPVPPQHNVWTQQSQDKFQGSMREVAVLSGIFLKCLTLHWLGKKKKSSSLGV